MIAVTMLLPLCITACHVKTKVTVVIPQEKLSVLHVPNNVFVKSIQNAKTYPKGSAVISGVVPHHLIAADLIAGFFESLHGDPYDTVIIIAPDHSSGEGQVISSKLNWNINSGDVVCDTALLSTIEQFHGVRFMFDNQRLQNDHSASNLIPYVQHYLPKAKVIPLLLTNRMDAATAKEFAEQLVTLTQTKKCLVLFSIDFSHYLSPEVAAQKDLITRAAIQTKDYLGISHMNNNNLDCPPALIIFLRYTEVENGTVEILENTDATKLTKTTAAETTSYFIIRGTKQ